jgi:hypothetical protein
VVLRPHARGERVVDPVGLLDGLVLVVEGLHGDHRAEDLVLDHVVVPVQTVDRGRRVRLSTRRRT